MHVVDHLTGQPTGETRNVLVESARIARGKIEPLDRARMDELDALVLPGGYGVAKNLSDFAVRGPEADVDPDLVRLVGEALSRARPIVALCISPAILAAALRRLGIGGAVLTIGDDAGTAAALGALGAEHRACPVDHAVVDARHRIISTPAYMLGPGPRGVGAGIEEAITALAAWLR
jgi:enhancing lycopene biosynthesis protein 2